MRIIPRLDVKNDRLVKGIQFDGLRSFGAPEKYARYYEREGADELLFMDVVASLYGRNSLLSMIARVSQEVFIPLTVGGGLRSLNDIEKVLGAGADRVAINTAAIAHPQLIADAAARFGSSTVVVSIEAKRMSDGSYQSFVNSGRDPTGRDVFEWAHEAQERGAGEILITSVDRDGTGAGFDLELVKRTASAVRIPLIASGGAGNTKHVIDLMGATKVDGVAFGSLLHYEAVRQTNPDAPPRHSGLQPARITEVRASIGLSFHSSSGIGELKSGTADAIVGIVACGVGNLASVKFAAERAGLVAREVTSSKDLHGIDGLILPGVGAFGNAMRVLRKAHLDRAILDWTRADRPLLGICLGMQLLFCASDEFGATEGLNVFTGRVRSLRPRLGVSAKSPHLGWNGLNQAKSWSGTVLDSQPEKSIMYFMHSYYVEPAERDLILSTTRHGDLEYCSAIQRGNVIGCQFHPERSGVNGLQVYRQFAELIRNQSQREGKDVHVLCHA